MPLINLLEIFRFFLYITAVFFFFFVNFLLNFQESISFLIKQASTVLPFDVQKAMQSARITEEKNSNAEFSLTTIEKNIVLAKEKSVPMCQDTGFLTFYVEYSSDILSLTSQKNLKENIFKAVQKATQNGILRPNAVDSISGKNSGDNIGIDIPKIIFSLHEETKNFLEIKLILKGGGSENVSSQYSLPCQTDFGRAGRDKDGIKKVILQAVKNAEGKGCAPGILGIHIGGDRGFGYEQAKKNFFQPLGEKNPDKILAKLEEEIIESSNNLGIGPMGFGGKSTILDAKISVSHRIPASFFVTIAYSCWALRRGKILCTKEGKISQHSWEETPKPLDLDKKQKNSVQEKKEKKLIFPLSEEDIVHLHIGEKVLLSGKIFTGRDTLHHYVIEEKNSLPLDISGSAIYHCGPVMKKNLEKNIWEVVSAGPTTSIREEPYQAEFIKKTGIRAIIGKGGMGEKTRKALQESKAVYFHAIGGAAVVYAEKIRSVSSVHFLEEFGIPEAMWEFYIKDFPVIVTMDSHGKILSFF